MSETSLRTTHPMLVIAAAILILTCVLAIGVMLGIIPSPLNRGASDERDVSSRSSQQNLAIPSAPAEVPSAPTDFENRMTSAPQAAAPGNKTSERKASEREASQLTSPAVGSTRNAAPPQTVAGTAPAKVTPPACTNCGTVSSVRAVRQQGEAGLIGPAAGTLVGGVLGNQIGSGTGNTIATIAGAAGGAIVGTEVERRSKSTTHYDVAVRMNDGTTRNFNYASEPGIQSGDRVRVVDGKLIRD